MKKTLKQFKRYLIVGICSTLINFIVYRTLLFLTKIILLSSILGYLSGLINSYIFARLWVFSNRKFKISKTIINFFLIYFAGGLLNSLTIFYLNKFEIQYELSWLIGNSIAVLNNFFGSKIFVFKK